MKKPIDRVRDAAADLNLDIQIQIMPESTRTAREAAAACGCSVDQIVKSLIFEGKSSGELKLILVSGRHELSLANSARIFGETLARANPARVRDETGFAIGGVAPIGHLVSIESWMDDTLLAFDKVWAAAGTPNAVFCIDPKALAKLPGLKCFTNEPD